MKQRIQNYIDTLFENLHETRELRELKEEMAANLLESVEEHSRSGSSPDEAFNRAVEALGDMSELVNSLKGVSKVKEGHMDSSSQHIDRVHVIGYTLTTVLMLFGLMVAIFSIFLFEDFRILLDLLFGTLVLSSVIFTFLGLTQETKESRPMSGKRSMVYAQGVGGILCSVFLPLMIYLYHGPVIAIILSIVILAIPSVGVLCFLGLTETSRSKLRPGNAAWQEKWVDYYKNEKREEGIGLISGALWTITVALFLVGTMSGYEHSWIIFLFAAGVQSLMMGLLKLKS